MRRMLGTIVALVVALSLVLIPATVSADLGKCTGWDKVKWENIYDYLIYCRHESDAKCIGTIKIKNKQDE